MDKYETDFYLAFAMFFLRPVALLIALLLFALLAYALLGLFLTVQNLARKRLGNGVAFFLAAGAFLLASAPATFLVTKLVLRFIHGPDD
jgi:hypothetical protein